MSLCLVSRSARTLDNIQYGSDFLTAVTDRSRFEYGYVSRDAPDCHGVARPRDLARSAKRTVDRKYGKRREGQASAGALCYPCERGAEGTWRWRVGSAGNDRAGSGSHVDADHNQLPAQIRNVDLRSLGNTLLTGRDCALLPGHDSCAAAGTTVPLRRHSLLCGHDSPP